jgi:DNA (cytosine-5)-methyltransferase 1
MNKRYFYEFFAGGGMARAALEGTWKCSFANDFSLAKASAYEMNWGNDHFCLEDVNNLTTAHLQGYADLVWASFPCQDLSLAGAAAGLGTHDKQTRSGAFWAFWKLMRGLIGEGRAPSLIILENVYGALTTNQGREFISVCSTLAAEGYLIGAMLIDAKFFVPQSRPRLFFIAIRDDLEVPDNLVSSDPVQEWHPKAMQNAVAKLPSLVHKNWRWLSTRTPEQTSVRIAQIVEDQPSDVRWHTQSETNELIAKMSPVNLKKLERLMRKSGPVYGTIYRRTRPGPKGQSTVMAELRDDGISGCLRTPGGGSSRQFLLRIDGKQVKSRLLSGREAARLMGLSDLYKLPLRYNDAYHLMGDGVVVPVVKFLDQHIFQPVLALNESQMLVAAE